jgi:competence protein ComEC
VVITGRVADDSRPVGGGAEVLVEPSQVQTGGSPVADVGNLMVRWRGPGEAGFGDQVLATGKLTLPRDLPGFDRRAYLAQRHVYLELQASSFDVTGTQGGIAGLPVWLRARYRAAVDDAVPAPHAAVLLGIVLGIRQGIPPQLQNALVATGLIHLLVLSGLKVAMFARIVQGVLNPLLRRYATWPAVGLIALYAMAGGATPAAVRASAVHRMCGRRSPSPPRRCSVGTPSWRGMSVSSCRSPAPPRSSCSHRRSHGASRSYLTSCASLSLSRARPRSERCP